MISLFKKTKQKQQINKGVAMENQEVNKTETREIGVGFKVSEKEYNQIMKRAEKFLGWKYQDDKKGLKAEWCRLAALNFEPPKEDFRDLGSVYAPV